MQIYFLNATDAPGRALVPRMHEAIAAFRQAGAPVIWLNWGQRQDMRNFPSTWLPPVHGAADAAIWPALDYDNKTDILVEKFRPTGFYRTQLDDVLRFDGRRTLFLARARHADGGVRHGPAHGFRDRRTCSEILAARRVWQQ